MLQQKQGTSKSVLILARYFHKVSGSIYCKVRNGENKEYCIAIHKSGHTTCTCKHGQSAGNKAHCYHVNHVRQSEEIRSVVQVCEARKQVATPASTVPMSAEVLEQVAAVAEVRAEAKMHAFKSSLDAQYSHDPREASETSASYARMFYQEW